MMTMCYVVNYNYVLLNMCYVVNVENVLGCLLILCIAEYLLRD